MFVTKKQSKRVGGIEIFLESIAGVLNGDLFLPMVGEPSTSATSKLREDTLATSKVRKELRHDISLLYAAAAESDESYRRGLEALVKKVNSLNLRASWYVKPLGDKTQVRRGFPEDGSFRGWAYTVIMQALEQGRFWYLRPCIECKKFFAAKDSRQRYCQPSCRETLHGRQAKDRVRKSRENMRRKNQKVEKQKNKHRRVARFANFIESAKKRNPTEAELDTNRPILKNLGAGDVKQGRKIVNSWEEKLAGGLNIESLWGSLPSQIKQVFIRVER